MEVSPGAVQKQCPGTEIVILVHHRDCFFDPAQRLTPFSKEHKTGQNAERILIDGDTGQIRVDRISGPDRKVLDGAPVCCAVCGRKPLNETVAEQLRRESSTVTGRPNLSERVAALLRILRIPTAGP